jgi:hypothetical protein
MIEGGDQREASTQSKPQRSSRQPNVSIIELQGVVTLEALLLASMAQRVEKGTRAPQRLEVQELACTQHIRTQRKWKPAPPIWLRAAHIGTSSMTVNVQIWLILQQTRMHMPLANKEVSRIVEYIMISRSRPWEQEASLAHRYFERHPELAMEQQLGTPRQQPTSGCMLNWT